MKNKVVWCPLCKIKGVLNEMEYDCVSDEYDYKCDVCESEYNKREVIYEQ